jgi:hypothetical protein
MTESALRGGRGRGGGGSPLCCNEISRPFCSQCFLFVCLFVSRSFFWWKFFFCDIFPEDQPHSLEAPNNLPSPLHVIVAHRHPDVREARAEAEIAHIAAIREEQLKAEETARETEQRRLRALEDQVEALHCA